MNHCHRLAVALVSALLVLVPLEAQAPLHTPTLDESIGLSTLGWSRISPDGRFVAYGVREVDWKEDRYVTQIWLANVASGSRLQLTRGKKSAGRAEWSPDGRWIAFVTQRESSAIEPPPPGKKEEAPAKEAEPAGGKPAESQIWLIAPDGGEAWQLTKSETDIGAFRWSKDGKWVAFTATPPESKSSKDRKEKYGDYQVFEKDYDQNQLWLVDVSAATARMLPVAAKQITTDQSLNVVSFAWSPDSTRIAFAATRNPLLAFRSDVDIYLLDRSGDNAVRKIVALPGPDSSPVFSPDGKELAFSTALAQPNDYYANGHIAVVDVAAVASKPATTPAEVRDLTSKFDEDVGPEEWGPEGIYFGALQRTNSHLFVIDPRTLVVRRLTGPDTFFLGGASFTRDFKTMAISASDAAHMDELYVTQVTPFSPRKLTDTTAQVSGWKLGTVELVSWKSQDGVTIDGVLHKPADYDAGRKYPLLVLIHGGPTGISMPTLSPEEYAYPVQIFLSKGALVLEPNYRGSAGYGAAFRALNVRNLGVGDMWDVMSGVDALISRGLVDPARLGAMGWSQGGYISAFLTTHTDRFKAISVGAGISNWMTYYVNTDITPFTRQYLKATPWDDPAIYAVTSPMTTIKQAKTPTLVQHGSNDKRVPPPNAFELYRGLQDLGVPSRLQLYTGFGHGINKPKSQRALLQSNLDWFGHYLWGEPIPKDSPLYGSSEAPQ